MLMLATLLQGYGIIGTMVAVVVFAVCVVIIFAVITWALEYFGIAIPQKLKFIIGCLVFLFLFLLLVNYLGWWPGPLGRIH